MSIIVTDKGQVTIPKDVLDQLGIGPAARSISAAMRMARSSLWGMGEEDSGRFERISRTCRSGPQHRRDHGHDTRRSVMRRHTLRLPLGGGESDF